MKITKYLKNKFLKKEGFPICESSEFRNALKIIKSHCNSSVTDLNAEEKLDFLKYALHTIKSDFLTSYRAEIIYKKSVNPQEARVLPFIGDLTGDKVKLNIESVDIFTFPWERNRISSALKNLKNTIFKHDESNHFAIYYPYMNICYVHNGIHSSTIAKYYNKGYIKADLYDMEKAFKSYSTDGSSWFLKETIERIDDVFDFRIAIMFEICKMIYETNRRI